MTSTTLLKQATVALTFLIAQSACGARLPNPVERADGYAWIPIADTAFLIPEKSWLKGFQRHSTDGSVSGFTVHATAPDVQPWSPLVKDSMYPKRGPGRKVEVQVSDARELLASQYEVFFRPPQSRWAHALEEVESDAASSGLRKFKEKDKDWGRVIYQAIENGRVRYFTLCDGNTSPPSRQFCYLSFPWNKSIYVQLTFTRDFLPHGIKMADTISAKLKEFEAAARARQRNRASTN